VKRLCYADRLVLPFSLDQIVVAFTVLVVSLTVHEAAHAWSADLLGDPTAARLGRVSLNPLVHIDPIGTVIFPLVAMATSLPLIGWARPVPVGVEHLGPGWRQKFMLIAAAGPASNLMMALVASGLLHLGLAATGTALDWTMARLLYTGLTLNVLLAVFNLLPVPPLDGGNVLAGLLPSRAAQALDRVRPFGFLILYALLLTGVLSTLVEPVAGAIVSRLD
jgi:Zn-dependent protease